MTCRQPSNCPARKGKRQSSGAPTKASGLSLAEWELSPFCGTITSVGGPPPILHDIATFISEKGEALLHREDAIEFALALNQPLD
jgi:hypothetical protein